ncbi:alpha/beta hydrolase [Aestuariimicrobium soli]|uniref:alpha/beta hydrolase n=1 Tax=Aestuariimicrobium soli TaxID=2035834 RepID=UPI003EBF1C0C
MPLDELFAARVAEAEALGADASQADIDAVMARPYGARESDEVVVHHQTVAGPHGEIPVRIYRATPTDAASTTGAPGLVWCHGGAFMHGDLDMPEADEVSRGIASRTQGVVVSVDYRLTGAPTPPAAPPLPEQISNQYPVAHDDVHAVWSWVVEHAADLGIDPARLAIGGASAGANLIAGVVVRLRDEGGPLPHVWLPIYPVVHARPVPLSDDLAADLGVFSSGFDDGTLGFIGAVYGATPDDPYGYIGERDDLGGLPRCLIVNDQYDELRASGERLAEQLVAAGVDVVMLTAVGMKHGHLNLVGHPRTKQTLDDMAAAILS